MDVQNVYTKETLLKVPARKWDEILQGVQAVYVIPTDELHDSGYACMRFVAEKKSGELIRFGGGCDAVSFRGKYFKMDCLPGSKIIRIWNYGTFSVSPDISSIDFIEEEQE